MGSSARSGRSELINENDAAGSHRKAPQDVKPVAVKEGGTDGEEG